MKQSEAVYGAVVSVMGNVEGKYVPTSEQRKVIATILFESFKAGTIDLATPKDDAELRKYIPGLISNWLRKDTKLNGGVAYVPANPGSKAGSGDAQLKALRTLLSQTPDEGKHEVQAYIDARLAEIGASKVKEIDYSALPEALRAKFGK